MPDIRIDRVRAIADWLETIPETHPYWHHLTDFQDLSNDEFQAVKRAMRIRAEIIDRGNR